MTMKTLGKSLLAVCLFSLFGCANTGTEEDTYQADRVRPASAEQAARMLGCSHDEVAVCIQTNCELEEFYCANSEDARQMFRAGEYRYE